MSPLPPGLERLDALNLSPADPNALETEEELCTLVEEVLAEAAADGAVYVELRFGGASVFAPYFPEAALEGARRGRQRFGIEFAPLAILNLSRPEMAAQIERFFAVAIAAGRRGLAGIDVIPPTQKGAFDVAPVALHCARAHDAGLGVTVHCGEFNTDDLEGALRLPGVSRLGHGIRLMERPELAEEAARRGITQECCLTSNVVLGAVRSYEDHPLDALREMGLRVTINTDNPVRLDTSIGREYGLAAEHLGLSSEDLIAMTRTAIEAAFVGPQVKGSLLRRLDKQGP